MKLQYLIQQVYHEPSLITPDAHASIRQLLESRLGDAESFEARAPGKGMCGEKIAVEQMEIIEGIAHIPIGGVVGQKLSPFERGDGAVDVMDVMDELDQAEADPKVTAALLDIDSPGGMVMGTPELGNRIKEFREQKPIMAFSNGMIASAAYWIASSTTAIWTTQSAQIGSIGVYLPVVDYTGYYEQKGIKVELIKAGKLKGIGFPGTKLSAAGREHLQERINEIYQMFTGHVRAMRGQPIADETMQGQTFLAGEAVKRGLVDGIVRDKGDVVRMLKG
jgi:signal peptide peptidase SppA